MRKDLTLDLILQIRASGGSRQKKLRCVLDMLGHAKTVINARTEIIMVARS